MKKQIFTLLALLLTVCSGALADDFTVGLTQSIDDVNKTLGTVTMTGYGDYVTVGANERGSEVDTYKETGANRTVYIGNTAYISDAQWRKKVNTSDYSANQWVGYTLTIKNGYKLNITGVHGMLAVADDTYKWKVSIQNASGTVLYESKDKTTTKKNTANWSVNTTELDAAVQAALTGLTGQVKVKVYMYQGGSTKYFAIPYLTINGNVEEDSRTNYTVTATASPVAGGIVSGGGDWVEGSDVVLAATPNIGYKFVKWTVDGVDSATNPYTISNISAAHTAVATFEALYKVTYNLDGYAGTVSKVLKNANLGEVYADKDGKYTIPSYAHRYFYREGYILSGWQDQDENTYTTGQEITLTKDITLTPTWIATTASLNDSKGRSVVTWNLRFSQILFDAWQGSGAVGYYTKPQSVNGETIAVPMIIDATKGKVDNSGRASNDNAQVNSGTKFTIPAVPGMKIEIANANTDFSTTTIAGSTDYEGTGTKSISYVYEGFDATIDIVINENNQYLKTIVVTYPVTAANVTITPAKEYTTYVTEAALDFTGLDIKAYVAKGASASEVMMESVTTVPAGTPLVLKKGDAVSYDVPVIASADAPADNLLVASDGKSKIGGEGKWDYVLSNNLFHHALEGVLPAGKAYLHLVAEPGARELSLSFEDGDVTAISNVNRETITNNGYFNLAGQRVAQPTKGLYIVNGRKVVVK